MGGRKKRWGIIFISYCIFLKKYCFWKSFSLGICIGIGVCIWRLIDIYISIHWDRIFIKFIKKIIVIKVIIILVFSYSIEGVWAGFGGWWFRSLWRLVGIEGLLLEFSINRIELRGSRIVFGVFLFEEKSGNIIINDSFNVWEGN